jgi:transketolase
MLESCDIREKAIALSCRTGAGHLAPSLSTVEYLTVLFEKYLKYEKGNSRADSRDRLILSKGHGAYAYYIILNELGFLPDEELENFYTDKATIKGCLTMNQEYMIEASTGSLGHGLPIAVGMAQSFKMQNKPNKVVCIVGDGEMQEGSNYEALMLAYRFKLDNLLVIVDANDIQAMGRVEDVALDNDRLSKVLSAFVDDGFYDIDGHDESELDRVYKEFYDGKNSSFSIVVARTVKGKGIEFMEHSQIHHFRCPTQDGYVLKGEDE